MPRSEKVPFASLAPMHSEVRAELIEKFQSVLDEGWFIGGQNCARFEKNFAKYCGAKFCVGCGSGLDALNLILRAYGIGEGDEVVVPAQTFIATALAVTYAGARPVFADIEPNYFSLDSRKLEAAITAKTKAVIVVHLYGQVGFFDEVKKIADSHNLILIEDSAQAHGATYKGKRAGALGDAAAFSFYPGKNLGALGDGGAVCTSNEKVADKARSLGNYGSHKKYMHYYKGVNSRLDELHAALLDAKLKNLDRWHADRVRIASRYLNEIKNSKVKLPALNPDCGHAWHIFAAQCFERNRLKEYLDERGIESQIHYPVAMHLHQAYKELGHKKGDFPVAEAAADMELSLPLFYGMSDEQIDWVVKAVNEFE